MKNDTKQASEFNEAISFLNRINMIFYAILSANLEDDINLWAKALGRLYQALFNDMEDSDAVRLEARLKTILDDINKYNIDMNRSGNPEVPQDLYWALFKYETELRKVYEKAGYQTKRKDDAMSALR